MCSGILSSDCTLFHLFSPIPLGIPLAPPPTFLPHKTTCLYCTADQKQESSPVQVFYEFPPIIATGRTQLHPPAFYYTRSTYLLVQSSPPVPVKSSSLIQESTSFASN